MFSWKVGCWSNDDFTAVLSPLKIRTHIIILTLLPFHILSLSLADEIPQGLQLIANGAGHSLMLDGQKEVRKRVLISSIFRLAVGYLFLSSLFMNIVQNDEVIEIFYDVLALEFVENIDDTTFALGESLKCIFHTVMIDMGN